MREANGREANGRKAKGEVRPLFLTPEILKAQQGDSRAFDALCGEYRPFVQAWCLRLLGSEPEAEQAAQEVFLHTLKHLTDFRGECALKSWLYRIAVNVCLNLLRTNKGKDAVSGLTLTEAASACPAFSSVRFEDNIVNRVFVQQVRTLIQSGVRTAKPPWDALDTDIFHLLYEEGLPTAREAALRLGRSENTVKYRLYKHINPVLVAVGKRLQAEEDTVQEEAV